MRWVRRATLLHFCTFVVVARILLNRVCLIQVFTDRCPALFVSYFQDTVVEYSAQEAAHPLTKLVCTA